MIIPTYEDMLAAHERIKPHIRCTPVRTSHYLNEAAGAELFFKCENFQEPGAFKVRGATNAVFGLDDEQAKAGVATMTGRLRPEPATTAAHWGCKLSCFEFRCLSGACSRSVSPSPCAPSRRRSLAEMIECDGLQSADLQLLSQSLR